MHAAREIPALARGLSRACKIILSQQIRVKLIRLDAYVYRPVSETNKFLGLGFNKAFTSSGNVAC